MPCVLLALTGAAQSWGTTGRFSIRDAGSEPSKSGVVGLVASALGRQRFEPIGDLAALRMGVRADVEGTVQRDFQTALGAVRADGSRNADAVTSSRYYLADAAFLVALEGTDDLTRAIDAALRSPRWPLFLGRKAFPPAGPVALGADVRALEEVLESVPFIGPSARLVSELRRRLDSGDEVRARTIIEVDRERATEFRRDQPLSFEPRRFAVRPVAVTTVPISLEQLAHR